MRSALACVVLAGCGLGISDLGHADQPGLYVQVIANQPTSSDYGRLVRVLSRGGAQIGVAVEGGTFTSGGGCVAPDTGPDAGSCDRYRAGGELALSVRPSDAEALLTVTLYGDGDALLDQKQVAIAKPAENGTDAGTAVDAGAPDGGAVDATVTIDATVTLDAAVMP